MFMPQHWTIVHPVNEESPLWNTDVEQMKASDTEILVLLMAIDDAFSQTVHARYSYDNDEIIHNAQFLTMFTRPIDGKVTVDLRNLHKWEKVDHEIAFG